jgi:sugar transferase (PEP-CTERM/EpsH1 system associated)
MTLPKVLYLTHRVPYPPDRGDRIRTYNILKLTSIFLACLADELLAGGSSHHLESLCSRVAIVPVNHKLRWMTAAISAARGKTATEGLFQSRALRRIVTEWAREHDFSAILCVCSSMIQYTAIPELQQVPLFVDLIDVDSQKWADYAELASGWKKWLYRLESQRVQRLESKLAERARAVMVVSQDEAQLLRRVATAATVEAMVNGVDVQYFSPASNESHHDIPRCVFVGVLDYHPNVDGLQWFCANVWPSVHRQFPEARFSIVGKRPSHAVRQLGQVPGVEVVGDVSDVRPYLAQASVVAVPLRIARGIQNKVLEAMAMGKAVVASSAACEGLQVKPSVHLECANQPNDWIHLIATLFNRPEACRCLGNAARAFVVGNHAWDACLQPLSQLLELRASSA